MLNVWKHLAALKRSSKVTKNTSIFRPLFFRWHGNNGSSHSTNFCPFIEINGWRTHFHQNTISWIQYNIGGIISDGLNFVTCEQNLASVYGVNMRQTQPRGRVCMCSKFQINTFRCSNFVACCYFQISPRETWAGVRYFQIKLLFSRRKQMFAKDMNR